MSASTSGRVVVVGGGLAGLAAGLACADAGADVTLLERAPRVGGATWSFERRGLWFDNGQHVFLRCCTAYRSFLDRIGASSLVRLQERLDIPVIAPGGRAVHIRRGRGPAPWHLAATLARYSHLSLADRARLLRAALALMRLDRDAPETDGQSFGAWLRAHGQTDMALERLWDLIALPTLNVHADDASLGLAAFVFQVGLLHDATAADIGWSRVPLRRLHADHATRALEQAGAVVRTSAAVDALELRDGVVVGVRSNGDVIEAEAVILAVPHTAIGELLPPGASSIANDAAALRSSPIVNVHFVFDRVVMPFEFVAGIGTACQWVFDRSEVAGLDPAAGQCVAVSLSGADAYIGRRPEELIGELTTELGALFPAVRTARVIDAVVTREHTATFRASPGTSAYRPAALSPLRGLTLAGAWTRTGWPATMEGAVRSGQSAAVEALKMCSRGTSRLDRPTAPGGFVPAAFSEAAR